MESILYFLLTILMFIFSLFLLVSLIALPFLPMIIALLRRHKNVTPIILTNLLLGWTIIGYIIALIWSTSNACQDK